MYRRIFAVLAIANIFSGCGHLSTASPEAALPVSTLPSIAGLVTASATRSRNPQFTILLAALQHADPTFLPALDQPWRRATVFAPTDSAFTALFAKLHVTASQVLQNRGLLNAILAYHVIPCVTFGSGILRAENGAYVNSLLTNHPHLISVESGQIAVDAARVVTPDLTASNGVVHVVDSVLVPPNVSTLAQALVSMPIPDLPARVADSISDAIASHRSADEMPLTIFAAGIAAADSNVSVRDHGTLVFVPLGPRLMDQGRYTVFAPTDAAFANDGVTAATLRKDPMLGTAMRHCILPGSIDVATLSRLASARSIAFITMAGDALTFQVQASGLTADGATLLGAQQSLSNGFLNVVDTDHGAFI